MLRLAFLQRAKLLLALRDVGLDLNAQAAEEGSAPPIKAAMLAKPNQEEETRDSPKDAKVLRSLLFKQHQLPWSFTAFRSQSNLANVFLR